MKKGLAILGSTGSIGKQCLEVVSIFPSRLRVTAIAAKDEVDLILYQIQRNSRPGSISCWNTAGWRSGTRLKRAIVTGTPLTSCS
jgi:1-deoxy-D-xylulose-5-phosphate reductoisomerase